VTFEDGRSLAEAIEEMHETVMCNLRIHQCTHNILQL